MTSPPITREAAEKIRKATWTKENTAKTQAVVDDLDKRRLELRAVTGNSKVVESMTAAIKRFAQLDKGVKVPE